MERRKSARKPARTVASVIKQAQATPAVCDALAACRVSPTPDNLAWLADAVRRGSGCTAAMSKKAAAALVG